MRRATVLISLATSFMGGACSDSASERSATTAQTSGVASLPTWTIVDQPYAEVGAVEGRPEYLFREVAAAARQQDGDLVVLDAATGEVALYDPQGRHRLTLGFSGAGPGEFIRPTGIQLDSTGGIAIWDDAAWRLTFFDAEGRFIRVGGPERGTESLPRS